MTKKFVNIEALKRKLYDVRDKLNPHDFREGKVIEGMNAVDDIIDQMAALEDSEMFSWAQKEVELAVASEKKSAEGTDDWQYGVGCYESAMKAYEALLEDNHSGMSIQITKSILNRLIDGKCLTPIEDTPDIWSDVTGEFKDWENGIQHYQCRRMSSLFKIIAPDGTVTYTDINRVSCVDVNSPDVSFHNAMARSLIDKLFPIKMPYLPSRRPIRVFMEELLFGTKGDFDTIAYLYILLPDGQKVELNRYFKEENGQPVPMEKEEWDARKAAKKAEAGKGNVQNG